MSKLIPAVLEKTVDGVQDKIDAFRELTLSMAHLDVMDGVAVNNVCWGDPKIATSFDVQMEVHLMVKEPLKRAEEWLKLSNVKRVIIRGEELKLREYYDYSALSRRVSESGKDKQLGIAFDPTSSLREVFRRISHLRYFLAMGVPSGFSGQTFNPLALENIRLVKKIWPGTLIGVDGGMNEVTIPLVKQEGVEVINAASYFWTGDTKRKQGIIQLVEAD